MRGLRRGDRSGVVSVPSSSPEKGEDSDWVYDSGSMISPSGCGVLEDADSIPPVVPDSTEICAALRRRARSARVKRRSRDGYGGGGSATVATVGIAASGISCVSGGGVGGLGKAVAFRGELEPSLLSCVMRDCSSVMVGR